MNQIMALHENVLNDERIFSFLVVFMAFAHVYYIPGIQITFGEALMFLCIPLYAKKRMNLPIERQDLGFVLFFCYTVISSMILGIIFDAPISRFFSIVRVGFYWAIIFYFGKNLFNREIFEKWMVFFSIALSIFIITQFTVYSLTGYYIPGVFSGLKLSNGVENGLVAYQHSLDLARWFGHFRPHGFLAEPAHCSEFLFISLLTIICNKAMLLKKKIIFTAVVSLAIVTTQSTTGILLLGLAWLLFMFVEKRLSVYRIPLLLIFIIASLSFIFSEEGVRFASTERLINIVRNVEIDGSSRVRLYNGLNLFVDFPFVFKLFGTGTGLFEYVTNDFGLGPINHFMNSFSWVLFNSGFIGLFIWIVALVNFFTMSGLLGKSLTIGFFVMSLGSSISYQPQMVWFFLLILADIREKQKEVIK